MEKNSYYGPCCDDRCPPHHGGKPEVIDLAKETAENRNFRKEVWTGRYLQTTLMCIAPGNDVGLEMHENLDQMFYVVEGSGVAKMGHERKCPDYQECFEPGFAIYIPAGTYHNLINTGRTPLKMFSIYAPPNHPAGTVQATQRIAMMEE